MSYMRQGSASSKAAGGDWAAPLPADHSEAMLVLDARTGSRSRTNAFLHGSSLPGADLAGMQPRPIRLAQAATGTMNDGGSGLIGTLEPGARLLRRGNMLMSASEAMQALQSAQERWQVEAALSRFHLDRNFVADVYAARAYVWSRNFAGSYYWAVPYVGEVNERVAVAIMRHEYDNPGTLGLMTRGDPRARASIDAIVAMAVAGTPLAAPIIHERRRSDVAHPQLSSDSSIARGILGIMRNQSWIAHHVIPFAVVRDLPVPMQQAMAAAKWRMDSAENLIALPRNEPTYLGPTNLPRRPWHAGSHPIYSADVAARLLPLAGATGDTLRQALSGLELFFKQQLITNITRYHQMLR